MNFPPDFINPQFLDVVIITCSVCFRENIALPLMLAMGLYFEQWHNNNIKARVHWQHWFWLLK